MSNSISILHDSLADTINAVMSNFQYVEQGKKVIAELRKQIDQQLGWKTTNEEILYQKEFQEASNQMRSTAVITLVSIYELLLKEIAIIVFEMDLADKLRSKEIEWNHMGGKYHAVNARELSVQEWQEMWLYSINRYTTDSLNSINASTQQIVDVRCALTCLLQKFPFCEAVCEGLAIRHIIIHNRGVMNTRTKKNYPICEVDTSPVWGMGLIYDLSTSCHLINDTLFVREVLT